MSVENKNGNIVKIAEDVAMDAANQMSQNMIETLRQEAVRREMVQTQSANILSLADEFGIKFNETSSDFGKMRASANGTIVGQMTQEEMANVTNNINITNNINVTEEKSEEEQIIDRAKQKIEQNLLAFNPLKNNQVYAGNKENGYIRLEADFKTIINNFFKSLELIDGKINLEDLNQSIKDMTATIEKFNNFSLSIVQSEVNNPTGTNAFPISMNLNHVITDMKDVLMLLKNTISEIPVVNIGRIMTYGDYEDSVIQDPEFRKKYEPYHERREKIVGSDAYRHPKEATKEKIQELYDNMQLLDEEEAEIHKILLNKGLAKPNNIKAYYSIGTGKNTVHINTKKLYNDYPKQKEIVMDRVEEYKKKEKIPTELQTSYQIYGKNSYEDNVRGLVITAKRAAGVLVHTMKQYVEDNMTAEDYEEAERIKGSKRVEYLYDMYLSGQPKVSTDKSADAITARKQMIKFGFKGNPNNKKAIDEYIDSDAARREWFIKKVEDSKAIDEQLKKQVIEMAKTSNPDNPDEQNFINNLKQQNKQYNEKQSVKLGTIKNADNYKELQEQAKEAVKLFYLIEILQDMPEYKDIFSDKKLKTSGLYVNKNLIKEHLLKKEDNILPEPYQKPNLDLDNNLTNLSDNQKAKITDAGNRYRTAVNVKKNDALIEKQNEFSKNVQSFSKKIDQIIGLNSDISRIDHNVILDLEKEYSNLKVAADDIIATEIELENYQGVSRRLTVGDTDVTGDIVLKELFEISTMSSDYYGNWDKKEKMTDEQEARNKRLEIYGDQTDYNKLGMNIYPDNLIIEAKDNNKFDAISALFGRINHTAIPTNTDPIPSIDYNGGQGGSNGGNGGNSNWNMSGVNGFHIDNVGTLNVDHADNVVVENISPVLDKDNLIDNEISFLEPPKYPDEALYLDETTNPVESWNHISQVKYDSFEDFEKAVSQLNNGIDSVYKIKTKSDVADYINYTRQLDSYVMDSDNLGNIKYSFDEDEVNKVQMIGNDLNIDPNEITNEFWKNIEKELETVGISLQATFDTIAINFAHKQETGTTNEHSANTKNVNNNSQTNNSSQTNQEIDESDNQSTLSNVTSENSNVNITNANHVQIGSIGLSDIDSVDSLTIGNVQSVQQAVQQPVATTSSESDSFFDSDGWIEFEDDDEPIFDNHVEKSNDASEDSQTTQKSNESNIQGNISNFTSENSSLDITDADNIHIDNAESINIDKVENMFVGNTQGIQFPPTENITDTNNNDENSYLNPVVYPDEFVHPDEQIEPHFTSDLIQSPISSTESTQEIEQETEEVNENTTATDENTEATEENTTATDENTDAKEENVEAEQHQVQTEQQQETQIENNTDKINKETEAINKNTEAKKENASVTSEKMEDTNDNPQLSDDEKINNLLESHGFEVTKENKDMISRYSQFFTSTDNMIRAFDGAFKNIKQSTEPTLERVLTFPDRKTDFKFMEQDDLEYKERIYKAFLGLDPLSDIYTLKPQQSYQLTQKFNKFGKEKRADILLDAFPILDFQSGEMKEESIFSSCIDYSKRRMGEMVNDEVRQIHIKYQQEANYLKSILDEQDEFFKKLVHVAKLDYNGQTKEETSVKDEISHKMGEFFDFKWEYYHGASDISWESFLDGVSKYGNEVSDLFDKLASLNPDIKRAFGSFQQKEIKDINSNISTSNHKKLFKNYRRDLSQVKSPFNFSYDDKGWVTAYLSQNPKLLTPSMQVKIAKSEQTKPKQRDLGSALQQYIVSGESSETIAIYRDEMLKQQRAAQDTTHKSLLDMLEKIRREKGIEFDTEYISLVNTIMDEWHNKGYVPDELKQKVETLYDQTFDNNNEDTNATQQSTQDITSTDDIKQETEAIEEHTEAVNNDVKAEEEKNEVEQQQSTQDTTSTDSIKQETEAIEEHTEAVNNDTKAEENKNEVEQENKQEYLAPMVIENTNANQKKDEDEQPTDIVVIENTKSNQKNKKNQEKNIIPDIIDVDGVDVTRLNNGDLNDYFHTTRGYNEEEQMILNELRIANELHKPNPTDYDDRKIMKMHDIRDIIEIPTDNSVNKYLDPAYVHNLIGQGYSIDDINKIINDALPEVVKKVLGNILVKNIEMKKNKLPTMDIAIEKQKIDTSTGQTITETIGQHISVLTNDMAIMEIQKMAADITSEEEELNDRAANLDINYSKEIRKIYDEDLIKDKDRAIKQAARNFGNEWQLMESGNYITVEKESITNKQRNSNNTKQETANRRNVTALKKRINKAKSDLHNPNVTKPLTINPKAVSEFENTYFSEDAELTKLMNELDSEDYLNGKKVIPPEKIDKITQIMNDYDNKVSERKSQLYQAAAMKPKTVDENLTTFGLEIEAIKATIKNKNLGDSQLKYQPISVLDDSKTITTLNDSIQYIADLMYDVQNIPDDVEDKSAYKIERAEQLRANLGFLRKEMQIANTEQSAVNKVENIKDRYSALWNNNVFKFASYDEDIQKQFESVFFQALEPFMQASADDTQLTKPQESVANNLIKNIFSKMNAQVISNKLIGKNKDHAAAQLIPLTDKFSSYSDEIQQQFVTRWYALLNPLINTANTGEKISEFDKALSKSGFDKLFAEMDAIVKEHKQKEDTDFKAKIDSIKNANKLNSDVIKGENTIYKIAKGYINDKKRKNLTDEQQTEYIEYIKYWLINNSPLAQNEELSNEDQDKLIKQLQKEVVDELDERYIYQPQREAAQNESVNKWTKKTNKIENKFKNSYSRDIQDEFYSEYEDFIQQYSPAIKYGEIIDKDQADEWAIKEQEFFKKMDNRQKEKAQQKKNKKAYSTDWDKKTKKFNSYDKDIKQKFSEKFNNILEPLKNAANSGIEMTEDEDSVYRNGINNLFAEMDAIVQQNKDKQANEKKQEQQQKADQRVQQQANVALLQEEIDKQKAEQKQLQSQEKNDKRKTDDWFKAEANQKDTQKKYTKKSMEEEHIFNSFSDDIRDKYIDKFNEIMQSVYEASDKGYIIDEIKATAIDLALKDLFKAMRDEQSAQQQADKHLAQETIDKQNAELKQIQAQEKADKKETDKWYTAEATAKKTKSKYRSKFAREYHTFDSFSEGIKDKYREQFEQATQSIIKSGNTGFALNEEDATNIDLALKDLFKAMNDEQKTQEQQKKDKIAQEVARIQNDNRLTANELKGEQNISKAIKKILNNKSRKNLTEEQRADYIKYIKEILIKYGRNTNEFLPLEYEEKMDNEISGVVAALDDIYINQPTEKANITNSKNELQSKFKDQIKYSQEVQDEFVTEFNSIITEYEKMISSNGTISTEQITELNKKKQELFSKMDARAAEIQEQAKQEAAQATADRNYTAIFDRAEFNERQARQKNQQDNMDYIKRQINNTLGRNKKRRNLSGDIQDKYVQAIYQAMTDNILGQGKGILQLDENGRVNSVTDDKLTQSEIYEINTAVAKAIDKLDEQYLKDKPKNKKFIKAQKHLEDLNKLVNKTDMDEEEQNIAGTINATLTYLDSFELDNIDWKFVDSRIDEIINKISSKNSNFGTIQNGLLLIDSLEERLKLIGDNTSVPIEVKNNVITKSLNEIQTTRGVLELATETLLRDGTIDANALSENIQGLNDLASILTDTTQDNQFQSLIQNPNSNSELLTGTDLRSLYVQSALQEYNSGVQGLEKIKNKLIGYRNDNSKFLRNVSLRETYSGLLDAIQDTIDNAGSMTSEQIEEETEQFQLDFTSFVAEVRAEDMEGGTFIESAGDKLYSSIIYNLTSELIGNIKQLGRQAIENVKEIDRYMTDLKRVTIATSKEYDEFLTTATKKAGELGTTVSAVIQSTSEFARLGYNIDEATTLAESAIMYSNVGWLDTSTATNDIITTIKAFDLLADDAMHIVDVYDVLGNKFAVSSSDVGEGLSKSASALAVANNTFEESAALVTGANEIIQDAASVGQALKTLSLRIRGTKSELEEEGESTEGVISSSKMRSQIMAITEGFDILESDGKTYKSTYEIMKGIAEVWDDLSDMDRSSLLESLAGKTRANTVAALLSNFEQVEEAYKEAMNSDGIAQAENEQYLDSIAGKTAQLQSAFEGLSSTIVDAEWLKTGAELLANLTDGMNNILTKMDSLANENDVVTGSLTGVVGAITTLLALAGKFKIFDFSDGISDLNGAFYKGNNLFAQLFGGNLSRYKTEMQAYRAQIESFSTMVTTGNLTESQQANWSNTITPYLSKVGQNITTDNTGAVTTSYISDESINNLTGFNKVLAQTYNQMAETQLATNATTLTYEEFSNQIKDVNSESFRTLNTNLQTSNVSLQAVSESFDEVNEKPKFLKSAFGSLGSTLSKIGTTLLSGLASGAMSMGISALLSLAINGIIRIIKHNENLIKKSKELIENIEAETETLNENRKSLEDIEDEYVKLATGVDAYGNNLTLTDEEFKQHNTYVNQIAEMLPSLVVGYTEAGDAVINLTGGVQQLNDEMERTAQLEYAGMITDRADVAKGIETTLNKNVEDIKIGFENHQKTYDGVVGYGASLLKQVKQIKSDYDLLFELGKSQKGTKVNISGTKYTKGVNTNTGESVYQVVTGQGNAAEVDIYTEEEFDALLDELYANYEEQMQAVEEQNKAIYSSIVTPTIKYNKSAQGKLFNNLSEDEQNFMDQVLYNADYANMEEFINEKGNFDSSLIYPWLNELIANTPTYFKQYNKILSSTTTKSYSEAKAIIQDFVTKMSNEIGLDSTTITTLFNLEPLEKDTTKDIADRLNKISHQDYNNHQKALETQKSSLQGQTDDYQKQIDAYALVITANEEGITALNDEYDDVVDDLFIDEEERVARLTEIDNQIDNLENNVTYYEGKKAEIEDKKAEIEDRQTEVENKIQDLQSVEMGKDLTRASNSLSNQLNTSDFELLDEMLYSNYNLKTNFVKEISEIPDQAENYDEQVLLLAKKYLTEYTKATFDFDFNEYKDRIEEITSKISTLQSAYEGLTNGTYTSSDILSFVSEYPELMQYANNTELLAQKVKDLMDNAGEDVINDLNADLINADDSEKKMILNTISLIKQLKKSAVAAKEFADALSSVNSSSDSYNNIATNFMTYGKLGTEDIDSISGDSRMETYVAEYKAGLISDADLMSKYYNAVYQADATAYKEAMQEKLNYSEEYYSETVKQFQSNGMYDKLTEEQKKALESSKTIAEAQTNLVDGAAKQFDATYASSLKYQKYDAVNDKMIETAYKYEDLIYNGKLTSLAQSIMMSGTEAEREAVHTALSLVDSYSDVFENNPIDILFNVPEPSEIEQEWQSTINAIEHQNSMGGYYSDSQYQSAKISANQQRLANDTEMEESERWQLEEENAEATKSIVQSSYDEQSQAYQRMLDNNIISQYEYYQKMSALNEQYYGSGSVLGSTQEGHDTYLSNQSEYINGMTEVYSEIETLIENAFEDKSISDKLVQRVTEIFGGQLPEEIQKAFADGKVSGFEKLNLLSIIGEQLYGDTASLSDEKEELQRTIKSQIADVYSELSEDLSEAVEESKVIGGERFGIDSELYKQVSEMFNGAIPESISQMFTDGIITDSEYAELQNAMADQLEQIDPDYFKDTIKEYRQSARDSEKTALDTELSNLERQKELKEISVAEYWQKYEELVNKGYQKAIYTEEEWADIEKELLTTKTTELYEDEKKIIDEQLERRLITEDQYAAELYRIWEEYYKNNEALADESNEAKQAVEDAYKQALQDNLDYFEYLKEETEKPYQTELDALEEVKEAVEKSYDEKIEKIDKQIEKIEEQEEEEEKLQKIEEARNTLMSNLRLVYVGNGQWATKAKKEDEQSLREAELETEKEQLQAEKEKLEEAKSDAVEKIEDKTEKIQEAMEAATADIDIIIGILQEGVEEPVNNFNEAAFNTFMSSEKGQKLLKEAGDKASLKSKYYSAFSGTSGAALQKLAIGNTLTQDEINELVSQAKNSNMTTDEWLESIGYGAYINQLKSMQTQTTSATSTTESVSTSAGATDDSEEVQDEEYVKLDSIDQTLVSIDSGLSQFLSLMGIQVNGNAVNTNKNTKTQGVTGNSNVVSSIANSPVVNIAVNVDGGADSKALANTIATTVEHKIVQAFTTFTNTVNTSYNKQMATYKQ